MNPKISIIVPIYNVEEYIPKCIESILKQTFKDFELILINDGSTDNSFEICRLYESIDKRIILIDKPNGGVSSARNKGIDIARGDYIAFVDPDDDIEENMYEILLNEAICKKSDIIVCSFKIINLILETEEVVDLPYSYNTSINKKEIKEYIIPKILSLKNCLGYGIFSPVNKLYKKTIFDTYKIKFDENRHHGEDTKLNLDLIQNVDKISFIQKPLYNYYIRRRPSLTRVVRNDFYKYILENKKSHIELCNKFNCEELIDVGIKRYMNSTMDYMISVSESNFRFVDKYKIIKHIIKDTEFKKYILSYICPNKFYELLKYVCIVESSLSFILLVYMLMLKQNINNLLRR